MTLGTRLALLAVFVFALTACESTYGAGFDYPEAAPVPETATVLAIDKGSDDDDPIRSRQQILDLGATTQADLLAFYRDAYPDSGGWKDGKMRGDQQLCLVNKENPEYTEVVEVYKYGGTRVPVTPTRRLVTVSRIAHPDAHVCGFSLIWTNTDLFMSKKDQDWGTVFGQLLMSGGPAGTKPTPVFPGTITLTGDTTLTAKVDREGRFEIQAPPGRYELTGSSPNYMNGEATCSGAKAATSERMVGVEVDVICPVR
jgi:hypothetical protein